MNSVKVMIEALITHYLFQNLVYLGLFDAFWLLFIRNDEYNKDKSDFLSIFDKIMCLKLVAWVLS